MAGGLCGMSGAVALWCAAMVLSACGGRKEASGTGHVPAPVSEEVMADAVIPERDSLLVEYERTPCFGMCPVFLLRVYEGGKAIYEGKNFVNHIGFYRAQIDPAALHEVAENAERMGYFSLDAVYDNEYVTDLPAVHTILVHAGKRKEVVNRYRGPQWLKDLYAGLDTLISQADWKPMASPPENWNSN